MSLSRVLIYIRFLCYLLAHLLARNWHSELVLQDTLGLLSLTTHRPHEAGNKTTRTSGNLLPDIHGSFVFLSLSDITPLSLCPSNTRTHLTDHFSVISSVLYQTDYQFPRLSPANSLIFHFWPLLRLPSLALFPLALSVRLWSSFKFEFSFDLNSRSSSSFPLSTFPKRFFYVVRHFQSYQITHAPPEI
jgi:hypothetical protein